jgi:hypothetical protein
VEWVGTAVLFIDFAFEHLTIVQALRSVCLKTINRKVDERADSGCAAPIGKKLFHYIGLSTIGPSGMMSFGAWMHAVEGI